VLLIGMCFAAPTKWFKFALWCSVASVLGRMFGYLIGATFYEMLGEPIVRAYRGEEVMQKIRGWYDEMGFIGIILAAITPIPYKVFTIASGLFQFDFLQFTLASAIGRSFRFFLVAWLIRSFGARIKPFLEKHFEWAALVLGIVAVLGFVALKYLK
jgi:membrane protein YqaA with SNARE-associated domain